MTQSIIDLQNNNNALYTQIESQVLVISRLEKQRDELLNVLIEVDEALYCASEWEVPIMLLTRVKEAIAKAKEQ